MNCRTLAMLALSGFLYSTVSSPEERPCHVHFIPSTTCSAGQQKHYWDQLCLSVLLFSIHRTLLVGAVPWDHLHSLAVACEVLLLGPACGTKGKAAAGDTCLPYLSTGCSASDPASCWCAWEVVDDCRSTWVPATHDGDQDRVPGCWLQPGPGLVAAGIWGLNQQMKDCLLSLPLSSSWK